MSSWRNEVEINLEVGKEYTIFGVGEMMAMTYRREIKIVDKKDDKYIFKQRNSDSKRLGRKMFYLSLKDDNVVLEGWDLPLKYDYEFKFADGCQRASGNACLNFIGTPESVRKALEKNLNEHLRKGIVVAIDYKENQSSADESNERMVYPEIAEKESHAVVQRILEKQKVRENAV